MRGGYVDRFDRLGSHPAPVRPAARSTCCTRRAPLSLDLRAGVRAALACQHSGDLVDAWQGPHPVAQGTFRLHLHPQRRRNPAQSRHAEKRMARHEVVGAARVEAADSARLIRRLFPRQPPPVITTTSLSEQRGGRKNGRWFGSWADRSKKHERRPAETRRGTGTPGISPIASTDFYEPSFRCNVTPRD